MGEPSHYKDPDRHRGPLFLITFPELNPVVSVDFFHVWLFFGLS